MTISVDADSGIDAHFQAVCNSPDDANLLAAGMQGALMMRRYQEAQDHPDLAGALDQVRVAPAGDRLKIEAPVTPGPASFADQDTRVCVADVGISLDSCSE